MKWEKGILLLLEGICGILIVAIFSVVSFWPDSPPLGAVKGEEAVAQADSNEEPLGSLKVRVLDMADDSPLAGAKVVVPETGKTYITDVEGRTDMIYVSSSGREDVTLLIYKEGYVPAAMLNVRVFPGELRIGPAVRILLDDGSMAEEVMSFMDPPEPGWVKELVDRYRPDGMYR